MQTFLPYSDFHASAASLDPKRLGKQRVECMQILNVLEGRTGGWANHPATRMWKGYEDALRQYTNIVITEWIDRGYNNTMKIYPILSTVIKYPFWLGDQKFHDAHKSNLLRKYPEWYSMFEWEVPDNLPYIWPI